MLISQESDPSISQTLIEALVQYFGVDDRKEAAERLLGKTADRMESLSVALAPFVERVTASMDRMAEVAKPPLRKIAERMESLSVALAPFAERFAASMDSLAKEPEAPGHERFFIERLGYHPVMARLTARQVHRLGQLLADEINQGRHVRAIVDEIAKRRECSALVISRRARKLREECNSEGAQTSIGCAAQKAGFWLASIEFNQLAEAACARDERACRELGRMAEQLAPNLPEKRGRRISVETCIHILFQRYLECVSMKRAYTYSDSNDDFVDPVTQATRLAVNNPDFSPVYASRLRKDIARIPPILTPLSGTTTLPGLTAGTNPIGRAPSSS
jgi:hypothetical protein